MTWTHEALCERAIRWLRGNRIRCAPVFSRNASCSEVPDAIGWSSMYSVRGSIVVECKASRNDFYADKRKYTVFEHPLYGGRISGHRIGKRRAAAEGLKEVPLLRMGNFRYFLCAPEVITKEMIREHAPDHGLLYVTPRTVQVVVQAPRRADVDYPSEIRYLRFAILNGKKPHEEEICQSRLKLEIPSNSSLAVP